jgi:hypothetical protein
MPVGAEGLRAEEAVLSDGDPGLSDQSQAISAPSSERPEPRSITCLVRYLDSDTITSIAATRCVLSWVWVFPCDQSRGWQGAPNDIPPYYA